MSAMLTQAHTQNHIIQYKMMDLRFKLSPINFKYCSHSKPRTVEQLNAKPLFKWKDLFSGQWEGPDPLLTSGRGCACIFPEDADSPIWVPDRPGSRHALARPAHQAALASALPASPCTLLAAPHDLEQRSLCSK